MSIVGQRTAIISLGSSCQTATQLRLHAQLISGIVGDKLVPNRLPFDWVISPIMKATAWLRSGVHFPASPDNLAPVPGQQGAFLWQESGIFFWHDFKGLGGVDPIGTFEHTRASYERGFAKLSDLRKLEKVTIVVANTQNNLSIVFDPTYASLGFAFNSANLIGLKKAAEEFLGRRCEMLCVTYADRCSDELCSMPEQDIVVARVPRDSSEWQGEATVWEPLLLDYFTHKQRAPDRT
jgi:hypothetical protein